MPGRKYIPLDAVLPGSVAALTSAQREIVRLLAAGLDLKEIAVYRATRRTTVKNQLWEAKQRAGARTTWQLVAMVVADELTKTSEARGAVCDAVCVDRPVGGGVPVPSGG